VWRLRPVICSLHSTRTHTHMHARATCTHTYETDKQLTLYGVVPTSCPVICSLHSRPTHTHIHARAACTLTYETATNMRQTSSSHCMAWRRRPVMRSALNIVDRHTHTYMHAQHAHTHIRDRQAGHIVWRGAHILPRNLFST
jgi:hypothetical protein